MLNYHRNCDYNGWYTTSGVPYHDTTTTTAWTYNNTPYPPVRIKKPVEKPKEDFPEENEKLDSFLKSFVKE